MLGISYFCVDFTLLAQEIGFHFVHKKVSRFHIFYVIWDIIPDLCTDVGKLSFERSSHNLGIWRSFILRVSYFEI